MTLIGPATVTIDEGAGEAIVVDGLSGGERWRYAYGARKRPFLHPVATPAGHVLTRNSPEDHPWHHGLWFTIKFVNEENFWEEYDSYGVLRHTSIPEVDHDGGRARLIGDLEWIRPDRSTVVLREHRALTHVPLDDDAYAIDVDTTLVPELDVVLDRTPFTTWGGYGGLAFRGRGDFHDTRLLLADGSTHDRVLGQPANWLDLSGQIGGAAGDAPAGVAVFDVPGNPGHPVPWYGSTRSETYGDEGWSNFFNAAFLWEGPRAVAKHQPLRFTYRVVVHDGIWHERRLATEYATYLAERAEAR
jgi:hypothetical protein